ncbi:MAG TPA: cupredoxin domain-containing protein [Patescibacteria group bacterium]|nr:cupredoxin domain-containing protein [Patescibacteria group bacterium]
MTTCHARQAAVPQRPSTLDRARPFIFAAVVVGVLAVGTYLAFGDFLNRPAPATAGGTTITIHSSMAGNAPNEIRVKAGTTVTFDWWTQDSVLHLEGGVHTLIAPELGFHEELPGESRRSFDWQVPDRPGTYVVYCDTCCGGKENPSMRGTIVIEA